MLQGIAILLHLGSGLPGTGLASVLCVCLVPRSRMNPQDVLVGQALASSEAPFLDNHEELTQGKTNLLPA